MDAGALFIEHYDSLCRYLLRFTGDADAAADAAQESFVRMLDRRPSTENPRAWLFTVATNVARESARTRNRRWRILQGSPGRAPHADPLPAADARVEAGAQRLQIEAALGRISDKERQAVLMREEGFTQREIAAAVGTTTGSVGTLIARALTKLASELEPERGGI